VLVVVVVVSEDSEAQPDAHVAHDRQRRAGEGGGRWWWWLWGVLSGVVCWWWLHVWLGNLLGIISDVWVKTCGCVVEHFFNFFLNSVPLDSL
jgi:hypothetical protein